MIIRMQTGLPRLATGVLVAAAAVMVGACTSLSNEARAAFAYKYFCPPDSITVTEARDLEHPWVIPGYEMPPPPAEIQADPKRLAFYLEVAKKRRTPERTFDNPYTFYEVKGCDYRETYVCTLDERKKCKVYLR